MEKTQSASISIIDHFASVDDPRMELAGKRQDWRRHRGRHPPPSSPAPTTGSISNPSAAPKSTGSRRSANSPTEYRPTTPSGASFPSSTRGTSKTCSSNGQSGFGKPPKGKAVEIDGKTILRSADNANGESPIHMASAWATANAVALGQVKTHARSNETTAIPKLLKTLEIKGCAVTIDAMDRRKKTARGTVKRGADYVPAVKKNQPQLWDDTVGDFEYGERTRFAAMEHDVFETVNNGTRARRAPPTLGRRPPRRWSDTRTTAASGRT